MKKNIFLSLLFFSFGFLTHAFFFPDFLANGIARVPEFILPNTKPAQAPANTEAFETKIIYDGEHFSGHTITIGVGNYLMIINTSPSKLMWLLSNNSALTTLRGYGESEAVRERMDTRGQFVVADKNNPTEKLIITVK